MQHTNIGWTDFSANLIKYKDPDGNVVHSCVRASEGCRNCYSQALAGRWGRKGRPFTAQNMKRLTLFFDMKEARRVLLSKLIAKKRMFSNDMTDWMGPWLSDELIDLCVALFALRPDVTFQTLTKHPDRQLEYFSQHRYDEVNVAAQKICDKDFGAVLPTQKHGMVPGGMPLPNLHLGTSAETQDWFDERWSYLRQTPAAIRFVSYEPALGSLTAFRGKRLGDGDCPDWLILGGESGGGHREMPLKDCLKTIDDCRAAGVPTFIKQDSGPLPGKQGRIPDSYFVQEFPRSNL